MGFKVERDKSDLNAIIERRRQQLLQLGKTGGNVNGAFVGHIEGMIPGTNIIDMNNTKQA